MLNAKRVALASIALLSSTLWSQTPAGRLEFDVASIKPNTDSRAGSIIRTPGGLTARNTPFKRLIEMAFQTRQIDLAAVPDALRSERFDIIAKAAARISGDQYWDMLRALLEDRFQLKYHRETKEAQIYELVLGKNGAKLGPKISHSVDSTCPVNPSLSNYCGVSPRPGRMIGQRISMARIAQELSPFAGRPVEDQTGLAGVFTFELIWTPDLNTNTDGRVKLLNGEPADAGPSFFTAVQEELGLKLEARKAQVEILVIDHADGPSQN